MEIPGSQAFELTLSYNMATPGTPGRRMSQPPQPSKPTPDNISIYNPYLPISSYLYSACSPFGSVSLQIPQLSRGTATQK